MTNANLSIVGTCRQIVNLVLDPRKPSLNFDRLQTRLPLWHAGVVAISKKVVLKVSAVIT